MLKKEDISIKVNGVKTHEKKLFLLCNLELYSHFKNSHPGVKAG
jgi:hypothetical protein